MASNIQPITGVAAVGAWADGFSYNFLEGASQSYPIGAPLSLSSGKLIVSASVTAPAIAGISLAKATGITSAPGQIILPYQSVIFQVSVDTTTTSGAAALGTGYPSQFTVGLSYQLLLDSTSGNYYMGSGTGNPVFQLLGYDPSQASLINGRVNVRILTSQTIWS